MHPANLGPLLVIAAVAVFGIYRRTRRNIGRQALNPRRLTLRIIIFGVICTLVVFSRPLSAQAVAYVAAGTLAGIAVAVFALRHTDFEFTPQGNFYTPHLYIGLAITALLVGRIIYRLVAIYSIADEHAAAQPFSRPGGLSSPLTLGILFLTAGYYICYYAGLLQRARSARTP